MKYRTTEELNVREGPGTDYTVIDVLDKGSPVEVIDSTGWLPILMDDNSVSGWVSAKYLEQIPEAEIAAAAAAKAAAAAAGADVKVPPASSDAMSTAMNYFMTQGWSAVQAAALVGNLMQESNLKPKAINPSSGATGIAQWLGSRLTALQSIPNWQDLQPQLAFVNWELQNSEKVAGDALRESTDLESATSVVRKQYERCGESEANDANRLAQAKIAYDSTTSTVAPTAPVSASDAPWMAVAEEEAKKGVREPESVKYFTATDFGIPQGDTPYCAAFANWCLAQVGIKGSGHADAISFADWGKDVSDSKPYGAIVVFEWSSGGHHVSFSAGDGKFLGGNQTDAHEVVEESLPLGSAIAWRMPV
jgi:uncharacterized protein (TIGR02594 family)